MDWQALWLTVCLASVTTAILFVISLPLGGWLALSKSRLTRFVEALVALPLVLPPTVLGFYLLVLLGPQTAPGRLLMKLVGHPLAFSFEGLVVGSVIYSFPFAVQPIAAGFAAIDGDVIDTARLLGAQGAELLFRILVPLAKRSLLAAAVLSFAHTVGEFGVVLMLGGGIPGRTRTLSIAIYDQVQVFDYVSANRTSLLLIVLSFVSLCFLYGGRRNVYA